MKKLNFVLTIFLIIFICAGLSACKNSTPDGNLWDNATYTEDTEFGDGSKTIFVEVRTDDKSVTFKVNTDKKTVGDALLEHKLISGEKGSYGLYVKIVNGIEADYNKTKSFWSFIKNGESLTTGVDGEIAEDGNRYELTYTKQ